MQMDGFDWGIACIPGGQRRPPMYRARWRGRGAEERSQELTDERAVARAIAALCREIGVDVALLIEVMGGVAPAAPLVEPPPKKRRVMSPQARENISRGRRAVLERKRLAKDPQASAA